MSGRFPDRRRFLKAAGIALALPRFDSARSSARAAAEPADDRRRMVAVLYPLSFFPANFFPEATGADYELPRYLKMLEAHRREFTVFSGLSHPRVAQTHAESENVFLTGCPVIGAGTAYRNTVSIDQYAAAHLGDRTRFPTLNVGNLAYLPSGARVPGVVKPSELFAKLFLSGTTEQKRTRKRQLQNGRSILDFVGEQARDLQRGLPTGDRRKLDEYFSSVREAEQRLETMLEWEDRPKPTPDVPAPADVSQKDRPFDYLRVMYDLIVLALQHDSSRLVTVHGGFMGTYPIFNGTSLDYHNLSHHGKLPEKIDELCRLEDESVRVFAHFLSRLAEVQENGEPLLKRTMVLLGSNLGNANTHETTNLPVLLAGGGFRHGRHLAFSRENNTPLCNLYVRMLQRLGIETSAFGSSKSSLSELEFSTS